jgi:hypothetical protein
MSTAEIIAELPRLTREELARVEAEIRELVNLPRSISQSPRMRTPRLARPEQSEDFIKSTLELAADASV